MSLVKVKPKYQVLIPPAVREKAGVAVGDLLEASVERGKITLTPKNVIDRDIDISLREFRKGKGRTFKTADDAIRYLHQKARRAKKKSA